MAGKAQRLGKAAGELNVGVSTIVEFLNSKGVSIDMNPNSKLEPEQYEMLRTQFAADQNLKEQSKLSAVKREKRETITLRDVKTEDTVAEDDDDFDANVLERVKTQPVTAPKPVAETPAPEAKEIVPETPKAAEPEVVAPTPRSEEHTSELQSQFNIIFPLSFFNDPATPDIYSLSLHDALPILKHLLLKQKK